MTSRYKPFFDITSRYLTRQSYEYHDHNQDDNSLSNQNIEIKNNVFNLHLSGDGCSISKTKINIVNFAFKVLNEGDQSLTGLYTLGNCIPYIFIN